MPTRLPPFKSNKLADLAKLLESRRRRARPGLSRQSYLLIDREVEQLRARLEQHHPDYFNYRVKVGDLPTADSCARFTRVARRSQPHPKTSSGVAPGSVMKFSKRSQKVLGALTGDAPALSHQNEQGVIMTTRVPNAIAKVLLTDCAIRNISAAAMIREIVTERYARAATIIPKL